VKPIVTLSSGPPLAADHQSCDGCSDEIPADLAPASFLDLRVGYSAGVTRFTDLRAIPISLVSANMAMISRNTTQSRGGYRKWCAIALVVLTAACTSSPQTGGSPAAPKVVKQSPRPGKGFPQTDDFYSPESQKLHETGGPIVRVCLDAQGNLTAPPELTQTSGSERLDQAGLALAAAGSGRYQPATENGKPVPTCFAYRILFGKPGCTPAGPKCVRID